MKVLIIGSGGREYTFGFMLAKSKQVEKIFFLTGNGGTSLIGTNVDLPLSNFENIYKFIIGNKIQLIVIGPEAPLVDGIVDFLENKNNKDLKIIGPTQEGAMLEGSKSFAKNFMQKYNIPTADYQSFSNEEYDKAVEYLKQQTSPYVIKADGLAAGKGVLIIDNYEEAKIQLKEMLSGKFGKAGKKIVIEEFLDGIELSVFVITDGENYKILPTAKDYKRIGDGDTGLNTGGMGAISPVPFADDKLLKKIEESIIIPTIEGLKTEKILYKGFIFFGLIKVGDNPYVIEYNARMGDPEAQAVLPRIKNDLADLFLAIAGKKIKDFELQITDKNTTTVVLTSGGYPEKYDKNIQINGIDKVKNCLVFQAGTKFENDLLVTSGGRVLAVTGFGDSLTEAKELVYSEIKNINFDKMYYRKDIGLDLL